MSQPEKAADVRDNIGIDHQKDVDVRWQRGKSPVYARGVPKIATGSHKLYADGH
jgi:hypothetical protein